MTTGTDELSADELAYLESGGKSGIVPSEPSAPAPSQSDEGSAPPAAGLPAPAPGPETASGDDGEDDEGSALPDGVQIKVDKNGRPRLVDAQGKFVKSVPHKAFHSERERRKAAQKEAEDLKIRLARGEERLAILNEAFNSNGDPKGQANGQAQQPANPLEEAPIDIEKDFVGWAKQQERQKKYLIDQLNTHRTTTEQRDNFRSLKEVYHADAKAMLQADPQFEDAYRHLVAGRHRELEFMGMKDEAERNRYIANEEAALVQQAIQQGQRPAVVIYEMAKARGFVPKTTPNPTVPGNGQPQQLSAAQQKIATVKNGQAAAQTLSQAGSGSSEGLTFASLAAMSDEEFARAIDGMSKAQVERFMGR